MSTYLLFVGKHFYPTGGAYDLVGSFTESELKDVLSRSPFTHGRRTHWAHILEVEHDPDVPMTKLRYIFGDMVIGEETIECWASTYHLAQLQNGIYSHIVKAQYHHLYQRGE